MRSTKLRMCAVALSLAVVQAAQAAAVLETPPIDGDGDAIYCQIRNVGSTPMTATIEGLSSYGNTGSSSSVTLPRGGVASHLAGGALPPTSCRFMVSGSRKNVRAISLYWSPTAAAYKLALPAR